MADTTALKNRIRAAIKANDNQEITGPVLQQALLDIVDELDLNPELENEAQQRQNGDTQLNNLITGIKNSIDSGYVYAGIATPSTVPVSGKVFYIATAAGTYTDFSRQVLTKGINILSNNGSAWNHQQLIGIDDEPTAGSEKLVKSGGVASAYGRYVENPEFIHVKTDSEGKILWAIKTDGSIYYGAGVPQQVIDYVQEKIADFSPDEYGDIVAFLNDLEKDDKTLHDLLNEKVDKEEGKSLINTEYAEGVHYIEFPEFAAVWLDSSNRILLGIKNNADIFLGYGVPSQIKTYIDEEINKVSPEDVHEIIAFIGEYLGSTTLQELLDKKVDGEYVENPEYIDVKRDSEDKILEGTRSDGTKVIGGNLEVGNNLNVKGDVEVDGNVSYKNGIPQAIIDFIDEETAQYPKIGGAFKFQDDPEGRSEVTTDKDGRIISHRKPDGTKVEGVGVETPKATIGSLTLSSEGMNEFQQALIDAGFNPKSPIDFSNKDFIHIHSKPKCALINISGINRMPKEKNVNWHGYAEVWADGVYFKKKVLVNDQGNSSMAQEKHNFALDFCEDDWVGDETTTIKIGNWVSQDSFHFKAYYTSLCKGECPISYKIYENILATKEFDKRAPYMDYYSREYTTNNSPSSDLGQNMEFSARCYPDGFPVIVFLNNEFYGIFSWQLKKHRDNFHMNKKNPNHIHLDGNLGAAEIWGGTIKWKEFEIRNPKNLVYAYPIGNSYKYDADVAQAEIAGNIDGSTEYDTWVAGSYNKNKIVEHNGHLFINTIADNSAEPIYHKKDNGDDTPDFKNKTGCGWINCTNTVKVKERIIEVSKYQSEIAVYEAKYTNNEITLSEFKEEIEKRFPIEWLIDYAILITLVQDGDSVRKNWQWTSWGKIGGKTKWYVNPYDMDGAFGINSTHSFSFNAPGKVTYGKNENVPIKWVWNYYIDDIKARYAQLRETGIINYDSIFSLFDKWVKSIGLDNFKKELEKWSDTPAHRDNCINPKWELTNVRFIRFWDGPSNDWSDTKEYAINEYVRFNNRCYQSLVANNVGNQPVPYETTGHWKDVTVKPGTYNVGDVIFDGYSSFYQFRALETIVVTNGSENNDRYDDFLNTPFTKIYKTYPHEGGVFESIYRISNWIKAKIVLTDEQMNYSN